MGNGDTIITYHKGKSLKDLLVDPKLQGTIENSRSCVIWAPHGQVLVDSIGHYLVDMSTAISADSQLPYQLTVSWYISWCISWHLGWHVGQHSWLNVSRHIDRYVDRVLVFASILVNIRSNRFQSLVEYQLTVGGKLVDCRMI